MEYVVSRCTQHSWSICQNNGLQYIDKLCYVSHFYTVTVLVEYIQGQTCYQRISHCTLLIQKSRVGSRFTGEPCTPFITNQSNLLLRIIFIHDGTVVINQCFDIQSLSQCLIPYLIIKLCCTALDFPSFRMYIIMHGKTIHKSMCRLRRILITCLKHFLCPVCIVYIRSATDFKDWLIRMVISYISLISSI